MKTVKRFLLPVWMLAGLAVFKFYALWVFYETVRTYSPISDPYSQLKTIHIFTILWPFFLSIEAIIYWFLRDRFKNRLWVHGHIWSTFIAMIIIPVLFYVINSLSDQNNSQGDTLAFRQQLYQFQFYTFWSLIVIGHICFIGTIVKSFSQKQEMIADEQATGFLDEFAD